MKLFNTAGPFLFLAVAIASGCEPGETAKQPKAEGGDPKDRPAQRGATGGGPDVKNGGVKTVGRVQKN